MPPFCSGNKLPDIFVFISFSPSFDLGDFFCDPIGRNSCRVAQLSDDQLSVSFRVYDERVLWHTSMPRGSPHAHFEPQ